MAGGIQGSKMLISIERANFVYVCAEQKALDDQILWALMVELGSKTRSPYMND